VTPFKNKHQKIKIPEFIAVGDIAGRFDELMNLIEKAPDVPLISLGDTNDRGPKSKEVHEYLMSREDSYTIFGNHEHMFYDFYRPLGSRGFYDRELWKAFNGGINTRWSYGEMPFYLNDSGAFEKGPIGVDMEAVNKTLDWFETLPWIIETEDCYLSHAALFKDLSIDRCLNEGKWAGDSYRMGTSILWNYPSFPKEREKFQIHGHHANDTPVWYGEKDSRWGVDLDTSRAGVLTGMHWPSKEIFISEYIS